MPTVQVLEKHRRRVDLHIPMLQASNNTPPFSSGCETHWAAHPNARYLKKELQPCHINLQPFFQSPCLSLPPCWLPSGPSVSARIQLKSIEIQKIPDWSEDADMFVGSCAAFVGLVQVHRLQTSTDFRSSASGWSWRPWKRVPSSTFSLGQTVQQHSAP